MEAQVNQDNQISQDQVQVDMEANHQQTSELFEHEIFKQTKLSFTSFFSAIPQPLSKRSKDRKKKKLKSTIQASTSTIADDQTPAAPETKIAEQIENTAGMLRIAQCFLRIFTFE